jgi:hypothetical protein
MDPLGAERGVNLARNRFLVGAWRDADVRAIAERLHVEHARDACEDLDRPPAPFAASRR